MIENKAPAPSRTNELPGRRIPTQSPKVEADVSKNEGDTLRRPKAARGL
jgi:hypothetical protein